MLLNEWLHGEEPFTTTSDWLLDSPYLCLFLGGGEGCGTKGEVKLTSKVTPPHSLYNYIHNKYMNLVSKKWLYKQTYKPSFEELHKYPNLINLWEDKKWLKYVIINFLAQCQGVKLTFFFW